MRTVYQNLEATSNSIISLLLELEHRSSIRVCNFNDGGNVVWIGPENSWDDLDEKGRKIQSKSLNEYRRFYDILFVLLKNQPDDTLSDLEDLNKEALDPIQQDGLTWHKSVSEPFSLAIEAIKKQIALLKSLHDVSEGNVTIVPDTNALLYNSALDNWRFDSFGQFTILLTPTVLSELDHLKINHRNENVRQKAERLIRQIKEYRRRGRLIEGITLVSGVSEIMAVATEPKMADSLPWFDEKNEDDRLLAGIIEAMRLRSSSIVLLVTRDINLQNKAEFADIPLIEPPEPN